MKLKYILFFLSSFYMHAHAQFFSYYDGSKWGLVNRNNQIIVKPGFDEEINYASNGYAVVKSKGKYGVLDTLGKLLVPCIYNELKFTKRPLTTHTEKGWSLVRIKSGKTYGLNDFDEIQFNNTTAVTVVAAKGDKSGLVNIQTGQWVNDKRYSQVMLLDKAKRLYIVANDRSQGVITADGKELVPLVYRRIRVEGDSLRAKDNTGRIQSFSIKDLPNYSDPDSDVLSWGEKDGDNDYGFGVRDINYVQPQVEVKGYDSMALLEKSDPTLGVKVFKNGRAGVVDVKGKEMIPLVYDDVEYTLYFYLVYLNGKVGIRHLRDQHILAEPIFRKVFHDTFITRYCFVEMPDGKKGYYDLKKSQLLIPDYKGASKK